MARLIVVLLILLVCPLTTQAAFMTGLERLAQDPSLIAPGARVALITNHTGMTADGRSTLTVLSAIPGVQVRALFAPEHGLSGRFDQHLGHGHDPASGLPVYSLYGRSCIPTKEMLAGINTLVFDIQDAGVRYYTYLGTLHRMLMVARTYDMQVLVLDRPNPLGGDQIEGAVLDPEMVQRSHAKDTSGCRTLTITHPIPTRHGMTLGELAGMLNQETAIHASLRVITMLGWQRKDHWPALQRSLVPPSPNLKDYTAALLYSAFGPLEATNLSVARGTLEPFHQYGAPWVDSQAVLKHLPALPGIAFHPTRFVPTAAGHPYRGQVCQGIRVTITDENRVNLPVAALHLVKALRTAHPTQYRADSGFRGMVGDPLVWQGVTSAEATPERWVSAWQPALNDFRKRRKAFLLYPE